MQFFSRIIFTLLNSVIYLTKGQLLFNAITSFGDWYGRETFMYPMRTFPSGCVHLPCIPWQSWKPEIFSSAIDFSEFNRNIDKHVLTFTGTTKTTKKPKEKGRICKDSKKTEESVKEELRVRDTVRGGRDKASIWKTPSPIHKTSGAFFETDPLQSTTDIYNIRLLNQTIPISNQNASQQRLYEQTNRSNITEISILDSGFQEQVDPQVTSIEHQANPQVTRIEPRANPQVPKIEPQANPQVTANEPHAVDVKLNKTYGRESPLIQVYVITSGSGGTHTSIGEGGYYGRNNGLSNFETFHMKMKVPENLEAQKDSIGNVMRTVRHLQESRQRNPLVFEQQERNQNLGTKSELNTQKEVENTGGNISNNDSDEQLNPKHEKQKEESEKSTTTSSQEVMQKVLGGTLKHQFKNY
ncbi:unnamed protein product [Larinioides sclopetarius]|uniref:Uncharacterized protein n=1 Tax=Larinioides sclopetarius TaxID=280406 RepID=A0AAV1ZP44_9ARAC